MRTVPRHGYHFVFADVIEEDDEGEWQIVEPGRGQPEAVGAPAEDLLRAAAGAADARRDNARRGRGSARSRRAPPRPGYSEALRRLGTRPRHEFARALLRDTRWDSAEAGPVPIRGQPGAIRDGSRTGPAATPACRDNGGRPMGAGVARRRPGRNRRRRRRRADSHGRPRKHGALRARPGAGADWRMRRRGRRRGRRRRIVGDRGGCPIAAHARAGARRRAGRRVRRLHRAMARTVDACRAGGKGRATSAEASKAS